MADILAFRFIERRLVQMRRRFTILGCIGAFHSRQHVGRSIRRPLDPLAARSAGRSIRRPLAAAAARRRCWPPPPFHAKGMKVLTNT